MKTTIFCVSLVAGLFFSTKTIAAPVTGGGSSSGSAVAPVQRTVPPNSVTPGTPGSRLLQPEPASPNQITSETATGTATTNQVGAATNGFPSTNNLAGMSNNAASVTASVNPITNAIINSNTDINGNLVLRDQAVTPSDRVLLTTLSQGVRATLGITPNGNVPVHFMINNGTVTVIGTVQSSAQSQSILSQVQQTPGVISLVNDLHVASPLTPAQNRLEAQSGVFAGQSDHAFSAGDQALLTTLQQQAAMQLGVSSSSQMPVHFSVQNGVVGVIGQVNSVQEKQAIIAAIQRTPGIVRVVDNLGVVNGAAGMNNNLPPTSRGVEGSNTIFLNSNNSSGF